MKVEYLTELQDIIKKIKSGTSSLDSQLLKDISGYIDKIGTLGSFSGKEWPVSWRSLIYEFGKIVSTDNPSAVLALLKEKIEEEKLNDEPLQFLHSEIRWNFFPKNREYIGSLLKELVAKYPSNPEFHHTYSHYFEENGDHARSVGECRIALNVDSNKSHFMESAFNKEKRYFDHLIKNNELRKAREVVEKMAEFDIYKNNHVLSNLISSFYDRLEDHELIEYKLSKIDDRVAYSTEKERKRLIEVLGFFATILAFLFISSNAALSAEMALDQLLSFILGLGIILIIFALVLSVLFSKQRTLPWKDVRLYVIFLLILMVLVWIGLVKRDHI